jgi:tetratricopeptide (TPR) repeat protein
MLVILVSAGRYEEAIARAQRMIATAQGDHLDYWAVGLGCFFLGRTDEALRATEEGYRLALWHPGLVGVLAGLLSLNKGDAHSRQTVTSMLSGMSAAGMIMYHTIRAEFEQALDCYEQLLEQRQAIAAQFASAEFFRPLRSSPRWARLAKTMNLP